MPTVSISPFFNSHHHDNNGRPASGWLVYTYYSRTTTKKDAYKDAQGISKQENPLTLDARGEYPGGGLFLIAGESYTIVLKDPNSDTELTWHSVVAGTGGVAPVATSHTDLTDLDVAGQHTIPVIIGLPEALADKISKTQTASQQIVSDLNIVKNGAGCSVSITESGGSAYVGAHSDSGSYTYQQANNFGAIQKVGFISASVETSSTQTRVRTEYDTATKGILIEVFESGSAKVELTANGHTAILTENNLLFDGVSIFDLFMLK